MFNYLFKTGTYYLVWKKFKQQIITIIVSIIFILLILSIYNDIFTVLKIANKDDVVVLMVLKYSLISIILIYNYFSFRRAIRNDDKDKTTVDKVKHRNNTQEINHQNILNKKNLKSKKDVILQKYLDKNNG